MRPLLALAITALILGSVALYMRFQASLPRPDLELITRPAEGKFSLDVTLTFDAQPDSFEPTALLVLFAGREVLKRSESVPAGTPIETPLPALVEGPNEIFVQAGAGEGDPNLARAVRVRALRDGVPIAEKTLWSDPGEPVGGTLTIDVPPAKQEPSHEH